MDMSYPEECRVLDIMKDKYYDAVQFFHDTNDKKQLAIAVKEYQRFCYFYEKMSKFLEFDIDDIEEDVYSRLSDRTREKLCDSKVVKQINIIRRRKAKNILEDEDVNVLNFQMFQYALKILHKEKKAKQKIEDAQKKKEEEKQNGGQKTKTTSMTKLILVNLVFFLVVAGGIMMASGHSIFDLLGITYFAAKKDDGL